MRILRKRITSLLAVLLVMSLVFGNITAGAVSPENISETWSAEDSTEEGSRDDAGTPE